MKKLNFLLSLSIIATLLFASCSKEESVNVVEPAGNLVSITATTPNAIDTKAYLEEADGKVVTKWHEGDQISVYSTNGKCIPFTLKSGNEGKTSGTFEGAATKELKAAAFPYSEGSVYRSESLEGFIMPGTYGIDDHVAIPMFATVGENNNFQFKALGGFIQVRYENVPAEAKYLHFTVKDGFISGKYNLKNLNTDNFTSERTSTANRDNKVTIALPKDAEDGIVTINIPVLGAKYALNGFTMKLLDEENKTIANSVKETNDKFSHQVKAGTILRLPVVEFNKDGFIVSNQDGKTNVTIIESKGLVNLAEKIEEYRGANIIFSDEIKEIDMQGMEWNPISEFTGSIEGNGVIIKNITFASGKYSGLIAKNSGVLKNITFDGVSISNAEAAGLIASNYGTINDVTVKNINYSNVKTAGAIVGENRSQVKNCKAEGGMIVASPEAPKDIGVGGLCGSNFEGGKIYDSYVGGDLSITSDGVQHIGGFVGKNGHWSIGIIVGCGVGPDVSIDAKPKGGNSGIGGFVGWNSANSQGYIKACYTLANCSLKNSSHIGGFIGTAGGEAVISSCYSAGTIASNGYSNVGGFVGNQFGQGTIQSCYSNTIIDKYQGSDKVGGFNGKCDIPGKITNSYFLNSPDNASGNQNNIDIHKIGGTELQQKISELNKSIENLGYEFTIDGATEKEPLKLRKKI